MQTECSNLAEKVYEKMVLLAWVMVFKLSKTVQCLQFCVDLIKKFKTLKAIYIHASESSHYILSKNDMVYRGLGHHSWDINKKNIKKDTDVAEI